eukprot:m51a1_g8008 hypothetical protein (456) ;mRNA; f:166731-168217
MGAHQSKEASGAGGGTGGRMVPFVTGASSFVASFVVLELAQRCPGPIYCNVRAKSWRRAQAKLLATIERYAGVSLLDEQRRKLRLVPDDARYLALTHHGNETITAAGVTDLFDFALSVNYRAGAEELRREWLPVTLAFADLCNANGLRYHYPGSLLRHVADDAAMRPPGARGAPQSLWAGGYAAFKAEAHRALERQRTTRGLRLCLYELPFVSGSRALGRCPDKYVVWTALHEMLRTRRVPPVTFGFVPADVVARVVVDNALKGDGAAQVLRVTSARTVKPEHMQALVDEVTATGRNVFAEPGGDEGAEAPAWDPEVFPQELFEVSWRVPYEPVGDIPEFDIIEELHRNVDVYLASLDWTPEFARAVNRARKMAAKGRERNPKELLEMYGLYKQATVGDYERSTKQSYAECLWRRGNRDKAKRVAWKKYSGLAREDAMHAYAQTIERMAASSGER